jgi:hypothetical protein
VLIFRAANCPLRTRVPAWLLWVNNGPDSAEPGVPKCTTEQTFAIRRARWDFSNGPGADERQRGNSATDPIVRSLRQQLPRAVWLGYLTRSRRALRLFAARRVGGGRNDE